MKVPVEYVYTVIAGRGNSTPQSIAEAACKMAKVFFGDSEFEVEVLVKGRSTEYTVDCVARAKMEVEA